MNANLAGNGNTGIVRARGAVLALRFITSLAWLQSALIGKDAKLRPDFLSGAGLAMRISSTFVHTALLPTVSDLLRDVVLPHAQVFAMLIAFGDIAIGLSLLLGVFSRIGGALAIARATVNILVVGGAGADTIGFNAMLAVSGGIVIATHAGRRFGIDRILVDRFPNSRFVRLVT